MQYRKPSLSLEQQALRLLDRGLLADKDQLIRLLQSVSYYRLSGYLFPFKHQNETYQPGTRIESILAIYQLDHELRMLLLDAVEAIEIHVRSQLAYHFSQKHGAFSYLQSDLFPGFNPLHGDYERWVRKLEEQTKRSRTIYRGVEPDIRKRVAASFSQPEELIGNWLLVLNSVRNRCAHHARLWNWTMGNKLKLPNKSKYPEWHHQHLDTARIGTVILVISYLLSSITQKDSWPGRAEALVQRFPASELSRIGLAPGWNDSLLWQHIGA